MKISGAIFDMDGTLLDSMPVWDNIGSQYAKSCGAEPGDDFEEKTRDMSLEQTSVYLRENYGVVCSPQEIVDGLYGLVEPMYRYEVLPKSGVIDFLESLKRQGVKMCVATATELYIAEMVLERLDMRKYFAAIFTCGMVGAGKHKPTIYEAALKKLGTPKAETPVFEDALYAIRTAKSAGFPVVGISDAYYKDDRQEIKRLSDAYIENYSTGIEVLGQG